MSISASVERWNNAWKAQQLRRQRWLLGVGSIVVLASAALLVDSFLWIQRNYFPANYLFQEQKFRLMHWGLLPEPLPEMVEIPLPQGEIKLGEQNAEQGQALNEWLTQGKAIEQQNFGYPPTVGRVDAGFWLGKYEVTYEQYDYYVWQQHRAGADSRALFYPTGATRDNRRGNKAVTQVSWNDAVAYTRWLSSKTGAIYRLPTEAEWEYAARAGTQTAYWWGDDSQWGEADTQGKNRANCKDCGSSWDDQFIAPVGQFAANPWGLYDTAGNVWEWTCSAWRVELDDQASRCAAEDNQDWRVIRGGSWFYYPVWLRSSARHGYYTSYRDSNIGFRVLQLSRTP